MLKRGSIINGYTVLKEIGRGGSSIVYLVKKDKLYVIKEVNDHYLAVHEATILDTISHSGIIRIIEMIYPNYLVLEYLTGDTLNHYDLNEQEVIEVALQLCHILSYLHHQSPSIIYRDLKPENIIYDKGKIKLIDFGISKRGIYTDCHILGTKGYSAPEVYSGFFNELSDLYSLGKTLAYFPCIKSDQLERIIQKCSNEKPDLRYQSIDEVYQALRNLKKWRIYYVIKSRNNRIVKSS